MRRHLTRFPIEGNDTFGGRLRCMEGRDLPRFVSIRLVSILAGVHTLTTVITYVRDFLGFLDLSSSSRSRVLWPEYEFKSVQMADSSWDS